MFERSFLWRLTAQNVLFLGVFMRFKGFFGVCVCFVGFFKKKRAISS